jgi:hypothetical protein
MSTSIIDRAPEHIQFALLQLSKDGMTSKQLVEWLAGHGIVVTSDSVSYHLRKNGIYTDRKWWIDPADTHAERMTQFIDAMTSHDGRTFRLWDLNLKGRVWGACTRSLLKDGVIEKIECSGQWYRIVVTKEELVVYERNLYNLSNQL